MFLRPILSCLLLLILFSCKTKQPSTNVTHDKKPQLLVFSKTNSFRHTSIPDGIAAFKQLGLENNWDIKFSEDSLIFNQKELSKTQLVVFLNTTGDILGNIQEAAFETYINNGGAFLGIHAATDTEHDWDFYKQMICAQFKSHPKQQTATLEKQSSCKHPATAHLNTSFQKYDEWYNFKEPVAKQAVVLLELDEQSYSGKRMHTQHPIAWYQHYEGGRILYTGMGHTSAAYSDLDFLTFLKEGIHWCLGNKEVTIPEQGQSLLDKELSLWDVWMGGVHSSVDIDFETSDNVKTGKPLGLNNDPKNVFEIIEQNGSPVLHITGEIFGGLTSKNEYQNYHFETEFKWGDKKWEPRLKSKRDSGILYHAKGKHGTFWNVWMSSLEFQVQEGDCGDFIALGDVYGDVPATRKTKDNGSVYFTYDPLGENIPLKWGKGYESGQASKSNLHEKAHGEWNTLEIYTFNNESIHLVNGHVVNRVKNARYDIANKTIPVSKGKIQIQSEAAEIFYKNMRITPIQKFPSKYKNQ